MHEFFVMLALALITAGGGVFIVWLSIAEEKLRVARWRASR